MAQVIGRHRHLNLLNALGWPEGSEGHIVEYHCLCVVCTHNLVPGVRLLPHVHVLAKHVLNFYNKNNWNVAHLLGTNGFLCIIKSTKVILPLWIQGLFVSIANTQHHLQYFLPQTIPYCQHFPVVFGNQSTPSKSLRRIPVVAKNVAISFTDLKSIEVRTTAILHTKRPPPDFLSTLISFCKVFWLLKNPGCSVCVHVLCRFGYFCCRMVG
mmetsp:Transcript_100095/g.198545  ORF Transcript_100095/g.198545 Transcript_100095/m.198545 type:complete len:211 (-) Transcript_100095:757-1389(-)